MVINQGQYQDYVDAWNRQEVQGVLNFHGDDCVYEDVAYGIQVRGLDNLSKFLTAVFTSIPDFKLEVVSFFATESFGAGEWIMSGTRPDGAFRKPGATIIEINDGKFIRNSDYHNLPPER